MRSFSLLILFLEALCHFHSVLSGPGCWAPGDHYLDEGKIGGIDKCTICVCEKIYQSDNDYKHKVILQEHREAKCTKRECPSVPEWCPKVAKPWQCCPTCNSCRNPNDGSPIPRGKYVNVDNCTICHCRKDLLGNDAVCETQKCDPLPKWCTPVYKPGKCCPTCNSCRNPNDGSLISRGKSVSDNCTVCRCRSSGKDAVCKPPKCTPIPEWCTPVHNPKKCCPSCNSCRNPKDGSLIPRGKSVKIDDCTTCRCRNTGKDAVCKTQKCDKKIPDWCTPVYKPGKCCPSCDSCRNPKDGSLIPRGKSVKIDDCTTCRCRNIGKDAVCKTQKCDKKIPDWCTPVYKPGKCCPSCNSCRNPKNGSLIPKGKSVDIDNCTTCRCKHSLVGKDADCKTQKCNKIPDWCTSVYKTGKCCPSCNSCRNPKDGSLIPRGKSVKIDDCTTCSCRGSSIGKDAVCKPQKCPPIPKWCQAVYKPGECCPTCDSCSLPDGGAIPAGSSKQFKCEECSCKKGGRKALCKKIRCKKLICPEYYRLIESKNKCCPTCEYSEEYKNEILY